MVVTGQYDGTNFVLDAEDISSETNRGIVELATTAESIAGTDTTLATHPAGVSAAINNALLGGDYDVQWVINWITASSTSFSNASASANFSSATPQVDDMVILDFTSD